MSHLPFAFVQASDISRARCTRARPNVAYVPEQHIWCSPHTLTPPPPPPRPVPSRPVPASAFFLVDKYFSEVLLADILQLRAQLYLALCQVYSTGNFFLGSCSRERSWQFHSWCSHIRRAC